MVSKPDDVAASSVEQRRQASTRQRVASILSHDDAGGDDGRSHGRDPSWERRALRSWLGEELDRRTADFSRREEIRVWCGTYNVNDKSPRSADNIQDWVQSCGNAELLVFSFQEFDLSTEAMFRYTSYREDLWRAAIEQALSNQGAQSYTKLHSRQLVGGLILVYVRSDIAENVSAVTSTSLATGLMGVMANKGAVAVRLKYHDTPLTFVNSHLAAFVPNSAERNAQFRTTTSQLLFPLSNDGSDQRDEWSSCLRPDEARPAGAGASVWDCDGLFWMGDLNYRLDATREDIDALIRRGDHQALLAFDQLAIQQQLRLVFEGFEEGELDFPPTFKFDAGTDDYDTSEKQRAPAYTDRIVYLACPHCPIVVERYNSHPAVLLSDHKPVSATLRLPVRRVDRMKRQQIAEDLVASLDAVPTGLEEPEPAEVELIPGPELKFAGLEHGSSATLTLDLRNCGEEQGVGDHSGPVLSDLLILSVRGRDLFLAVSLESWIPTVLGAPLDHLVQLRKPIRETTLSDRAAIGRSTLNGLDAGSKDDAATPATATAETIPLVIRRLVAFLAESGLGLPDLFQAQVEEENVRVILRCLDTASRGDTFAQVSSFDQDQQPRVDSSEGDKSDKQHLVDAVDLLDKLETDLGSVSLDFGPREHLEPALPLSGSNRDAASSGLTGGGGGGGGGRETTPATAYAAAACLVRILKALPEPVVETRLYEAAIRSDSREAAYEVLHSLKEVHANTLLYLVAFLRILLRQQTSAAERAYLLLQLALTFSKVLLRPPSRPPRDDEEGYQLSENYAPDGIDPGSVPRRAKEFVAFLLQEEEPQAA
ncbi:DNase I-like protein [Rhodotorula sp. JG-1b]|nr:DNase I-like protein [Rhodotorula sp. JG-1b]